MKKQILLTVALMLTAVAMSQDSNGVSVKFYGFIRNYLTYDSRQTYAVIGGEYNMLPYDEMWNQNRTEDLNAVPTMQLQALSSRFGIRVTGPRLLGLRSGARMEGDFGGFGSNNHELRLRLAYLRLYDENMEVVMGQDWHPLSGSIMPEVLGMACGAPFRPHSRTPQIRVSSCYKSFGYTAALLWQLQYMNNGPAGPTDPTSVASISFANRALWPEAFIGVHIKQGPLFVQIGADAQVIRPRSHALVDGVTRKVDETVSSVSPTLYAQYVEGLWSVKSRFLMASNTSHLNQLVGYAVTGVNPDGSWNYRPMHASISYLNVSYGRKYRVNLFLGYMKNLGASGTLYDFGDGSYLVYMKGGDNFTHLNSLYRVSPGVSYNVSAFNVGIEYELTAATYGDLTNKGTVAINGSLHQVTNHRVCAMVRYYCCPLKLRNASNIRPQCR